MLKKNVVLPSSNLLSIPALLLLVFGLASCGSGGGGTSTPSLVGGANQNERPATASNTITEFSDAGAGKVTAASENSLTEGTVVTISGTDSYNGTYTVEEATPQEFTVATPFTENETGLWQMAGSIASGCTTPQTTSAITLANVPSRTTGVAPLSVFFDATATTATATTRPFHDLEYRWDFGDPAGSLVHGANWTVGSGEGNNSRNTAIGPVASHVFETPGTYTVALAATDGTNTANSCTQIVVQNPDEVFAGTNTVCIGSSSLPVAGVNGCPVGATTAQKSDFVSAIQNYALTGKRLLFKRGDGFTAATSATLNRPGPGIVGAFGVGAAPVVKMTGDASILILSSRVTPGMSDWRVMDMALDGMSKPASKGIESAGGINQITLLRLQIYDTHTGISLDDSILDYLNSHGYPGHATYDQVAIVDTSVLRTMGGRGGNGIQLAVSRLSMLGSVVDDTTLTEHGVRIFNLNKGVLSNNMLSRQSPTKHVLKLHSKSWCDVGSPAGTCVKTASNYRTNTPPIGVAGSYSEHIVISDNALVSGNGTDWTVNVGPQNAQSDERLRDIIVERNWFEGGNTTQVGLVMNGSDFTVRNNICLNSGKCVQVSARDTNSVEPPPKNGRVYNNTIYSNSTRSGDVIGVSICPQSSNITVQNNLGTSPFAISPRMVGDEGSGNIQGNNLLNNTPTVLFVNGSPSAPADFNLLPAPSPAQNAGLLTVPVFSDFFGASRLQSGMDVGAINGG